jgi:hypothetical protein
MEKLLTKRNTMILVGVLALWRLHLSAELELHPDEDDYWLWSRYPDVGYFDHPPLGLLCFLPVVLWNGNHEWVSFPLQLNNGLGGEGYSLDKVAEYIGQLFVAGPVVWFLGHQLSAEIIYDTDTNLAAQTARISRPSQFNMWRSPKDAGRTDGLYFGLQTITSAPTAHFSHPHRRVTHSTSTAMECPHARTTPCRARKTLPHPFMPASWTSVAVNPDVVATAAFARMKIPLEATP